MTTIFFPIKKDKWYRPYKVDLVIGHTELKGKSRDLESRQAAFHGSGHQDCATLTSSSLGRLPVPVWL
uniref:Uncharacterized protein n=1 Tax=Setaria italica TaxID=4555 RepID=K3YKN1_SETIT